MDAKRFDRLLTTLAMAPTRRRALHLLAAVGFGERLAHPPLPVAAKKRKKTKVTLCRDGQTIQVAKKAKKKHLRQGATLGTCAVSPPAPLSPPPPPRVADAACPGPPTGSTGSGPNGRVAQTFRAPNSGRLLSTQLLLVKPGGSTGDFLLQLNTVDITGVPTNNSIAAATLPDANVAPGESLFPFNFPVPATLVAGTTYALVVSRPGGSGFGWRFQLPTTCQPELYESNSLTGAFSRVDDDPISLIYTTTTAP